MKCAVDNHKRLWVWETIPAQKNHKLYELDEPEDDEDDEAGVDEDDGTL